MLKQYEWESVSDRTQDPVQSSSPGSWMWSFLDTEQIMAMMMVIRTEIISLPTSRRRRGGEGVGGWGARAREREPDSLWSNYSFFLLSLLLH